MSIEVLRPIDDATKQDDDLVLWSVTTIIGVLDKPALIYWAAEETAKAAVKHERQWKALAENDTADAIDWLKGARFRVPRGQRTAAKLGEDVHAACEEYVLSGTRPECDDEVRPFLDQFDRWLELFQPSFQAAEVTVYSPKLGVAGTADAFLTIDGLPLIADYKTSRKSFDAKGKPTTPYPEQVGLQLSAYRNAELAAVWRPRRMEQYRRRYYLLSPAEQAAAVPVPPVEGGVCIHITPEHCVAYPVACDVEVYDFFLAAQDCARWVFQQSKNAMGEPLFPREVAS